MSRSLYYLIIDFCRPNIYRLKIDDSTGSIFVTLWKSLVFTSKSLEHSKLSNTKDNCNSRDQYKDLYNILGSIQKQIKEPTINHNIMYEPKQGDLVLIRGHIKCYKQNISINAVSCVRIEGSTEELIQIMLPAILNDKVYSVKPPSKEEFDKLNEEMNVLKKKSEILKENLNLNKIDDNGIKDMNAFLAMVNKKLIQLTTKSGECEWNTESCKSYTLYTFLKTNSSVEYKSVTHKQVLDALKELELRGLVYSCEDETRYLPIN